MMEQETQKNEIETEKSTPEVTPDSGEAPARPDGKSRLKALFNDVLDIAESVITSVFVVLLFFAFILRPVIVDGSSMLPTLMDEDRVLMFEWFYTPQPGDVVIVDGTHAHVLDENKNVIEKRGIGINLIKRVVGVAGQEINIDFTKGIVYRDGVALEEGYINALTTSNDGAFTYPLTVPEGYIFVMGDNRNASTDSRSSLVGLVKEDDVIGHALVRIYRDADKRADWSDQFGLLK